MNLNFNGLAYQETCLYADSFTLANLCCTIHSKGFRKDTITGQQDLIEQDQDTHYTGQLRKRDMSKELGIVFMRSMSLAKV